MSAPSPPLHGWSHSIELTIAVQPVVDAPLIRSKETTAAQALDPNPVLSRAQHVAHPNSHDTHPTSPSHLVTINGLSYLSRPMISARARHQM